MTETPEQEPEHDEPPAAPQRRPSGERRRQGGDGLGSLVGGGSSQVGTNGAMRARDVSRPR
ncbi:MAG: hypothetical protein QOJ11_4350 [Frankiales bacterium]|jgi:hypothetical protein|nr:hypothetical protein [Frankiales bacterium]